MKPITTRVRFHLRQGFGGQVVLAIAGISVAFSLS
jgi:hypothetical protein